MKRVLVIATLALSSLAFAGEAAADTTHKAHKGKKEKKTETKTETKTESTDTGAAAGDKKAE